MKRRRMEKVQTENIGNISKPGVGCLRGVVPHNCLSEKVDECFKSKIISNFLLVMPLLVLSPKLVADKLRISW